MSSTIENFKRSWAHTRGLTHDFIAAVPDEHWQFSPHPRFATFAKQVRHLVCMSGVYGDGLRDRHCDFGRKHEHYKGPLDHDSLVAALREKDQQLDEVLAAITPEAEESYLIDFYGQNPLGAYLNVFIHHEAMHHGQWAFYAALASFETPESWKLNWGLG